MSQKDDGLQCAACGRLLYRALKCPACDSQFCSEACRRRHVQANHKPGEWRARFAVPVRVGLALLLAAGLLAAGWWLLTR